MGKWNIKYDNIICRVGGMEEKSCTQVGGTGENEVRAGRLENRK